MSSFGYGGSQGRWDSQSLSLTLGSVFGIRVRLHLLWILVAIHGLLLAYGMQQFELYFVMGAVLFFSVLLHEFGHCFGCRAVGGQADDILMWPLGGLASCASPHRPFENLITIVSGPAVNLAICTLLLPVLFLYNAVEPVLFNPFVLITPQESRFALYLAITFKVNYFLLLFNVLLPVYPLDGGQILQSLLWFRMSHYNATMITTGIGMAGSVVLGLICVYYQELFVAFIFLFCFLRSWQVRKEMEMMGALPENEFGYDFSQGYTSLEQSMPKIRKASAGPSLRSQFSAWLNRRRKRQEAELEAELDRILEKIHSHGMDSLTRYERTTLLRASKRRQR